MNKESKLNLNAGNYAIRHCILDQTYNGLDVHKMLCDAYIAGNNDTLEDEDERIRKALINVFATHKDYEMFFGVSVEDIHAWLERQGIQKQELIDKACRFLDGYSFIPTYVIKELRNEFSKGG